MCQGHWDRLRAAIADRGLSALVADSGEKAASNMARELAEGKPTVDTYDPLMAAFWAISNNGMDFIQSARGNPLALMYDDPNRPFPRCTICYLNWLVDQHNTTCTVDGCAPREPYDWMVDRAADDQVDTWKSIAGTTP